MQARVVFELTPMFYSSDPTYLFFPRVDNRCGPDVPSSSSAHSRPNNNTQD